MLGLTADDMKRIDKNGVKKVIKILEEQLEYCHLNKYDRAEIEEELKELKALL